MATAFALAVSFPRAGNLGGGGFLIYRAPDGSHAALDFRETAPRALTAAMFVDASGRVDPTRSRKGGLAVGVPGTVAGLAEAHKRWGTRPWDELIQPAIRLADEGIVVSEVTAEILLDETRRLAADPAAAAIFTKNGAPMREGDRVVQKDLANTLRAIASQGAAGFYEGPIAEAIVKGTSAVGGVMTPADLAGYRPSRESRSRTYRGRTIVVFPPPRAEASCSFRRSPCWSGSTFGVGSRLRAHAPPHRRGGAPRACRSLGLPRRSRRRQVPVKALLDPAYLAARASTIRDDRATPSSKIRPGSPPTSGGMNTLNLSIADDRGAALALSTTLNEWYGAALVAPGTGVLLNDEIDDFALGKGSPISTVWSAGLPTPSPAASVRSPRCPPPSWRARSPARGRCSFWAVAAGR